MEVIERPAIQVVGIQHDTEHADLDATVESTWAELHEQADAIVGRTGGTFVVLITELGDGRDRVFAGAQVDAGTSPPPGMDAELVYEARWLHDHHISPVDDLRAGFDRLRDATGELGEHDDGVRMIVGWGREGTHDLYLRLA